MIISVTQIVIIGDQRVEKTASAQIANAHPARLKNQKGDRDQITETARALFESLDCPPTPDLCHPPT